MDWLFLEVNHQSVFLDGYGALSSFWLNKSPLIKHKLKKKDLFQCRKPKNTSFTCSLVFLLKQHNHFWQSWGPSGWGFHSRRTLRQKSPAGHAACSLWPNPNVRSGRCPGFQGPPNPDLKWPGRLLLNRRLSAPAVCVCEPAVQLFQALPE